MNDDNSATNASLRSRQQQQYHQQYQQQQQTRMGATNGKPSFPTTATSSSSSSAYPNPTTDAKSKRSSPYLPTPLESAVLLAYPTILAFGALFSVLSPETRNAAYDPIRQSHSAAEAPSYFARKDNVLNVVFVKRGWAWITVAFAFWVGSHASFGGAGGDGGEAGWMRRARAVVRWALVTGWWVLVTQWCFGPPIIDRGFRFTGGKCDVAAEAISEGVADTAELFTAVACKAAGGRWSGGHDISGHVFLLVLGSCFLVQEVGWVVLRAGRFGASWRDERAVVMPDGAVKGAGVEAEKGGAVEERTLGFGGKFAVGVVGLCLWMLLMTAIYFHTWFEKVGNASLPFFPLISISFANSINSSPAC
ncbi:inositol phospholipid synthesis and fat-storage-inducing TM-domain-containing protein [Rostrohypoxylon terebratum]|nr:inositol phospholipid synthesis and fat-storage-inducing TM-domain-containing protein [Rostrohypoxylon terebratum]